MTTGQKCRTIFFSIIPVLAYYILVQIFQTLPLFFPTFHPPMAIVQTLILAGCVLLGFLLFRGKEGISAAPLKEVPKSDLLSPVMAALFLYASGQLAQMIIFRSTQQMMIDALSGEKTFLDCLNMIAGGSTGYFGGWQYSFFLLLIAPIGEEILFRYFPLTLSRKFTSVPALCICSGILFAWMHGAGLVGFVHYLLGGAVLALLFLKTGKLWHCILAHMLYNATTMIRQFQYSWHCYEGTGFDGVAWAVVQLVVLAVPVIWVFRNAKTVNPISD